MKFLGNRSPQDFFSTFWEKEILHIPSAVEIPTEPILESDLIEMAADEYFEARLIQYNDKIKIQNSPLKIKNFKELTGKWTLMIHNLNLYNEFALSLEKTVEFIPKWLFDDVMCSVSSKDSIINAHIDNYNVFILQVKGSRKWLIEKNPDKKYQDDCDLKILENFNPDSEFILNPGDMIYIPPHVAHEGISLEDSISVSIGFKSIEDKDLVENYLVNLMENINTDDFLKTELKNASTDPFLIEQDIVNELYDRMNRLVSNKEEFSKWVNSYMATPKKKPEITDDKLCFDTFKAELKDGVFCFDEFIRMSTMKQKDHFLVNLNEYAFNLDEKQYITLRELIANKHLEMENQDVEGLENILFDLYKNNLLMLIDKED